MQVSSIQPSQNSFAHDVAVSAATRGTRDAIGAALDKALPLAPVKVAQVASTSYGEILGLDRQTLPGNPFAYLATPEGRETYREMVKMNLESPKQAPKSLKEFAAKTLYGDNLATITNPLAEGKVFTAASKVAGFGLGVAPVVAKTASTYKTTGSVIEASQTALKEGTKETLAWEMGTVAFKVAQAVTPLKGLQVLASLAAMAAASNAVRRVID